MTAEVDKKLRGLCPTCMRQQNSQIIHEHSVDWTDENSGVYGHMRYRILQCLGCETIYFQKTESCSEDSDFYHDDVTGQIEGYIPETISYWPSVPKPKRSQPQWYFSLADEELRSLIGETYKALDNDMLWLAAIGVRTCFDYTTSLIKVNSNQSFEKKLIELEAAGKISSEEKATLLVLTDAGSAAVHRGWKPRLPELDTMMQVLENFIERTIVLPANILKLEATIPPRKR